MLLLKPFVVVTKCGRSLERVDAPWAAEPRTGRNEPLQGGNTGLGHCSVSGESGIAGRGWKAPAARSPGYREKICGTIISTDACPNQAFLPPENGRNKRNWLCSYQGDRKEQALTDSLDKFFNTLWLEMFLLLLAPGRKLSGKL